MNQKQPTSRIFKNEIYGQLARIGKAISSPRRIEILDLLAQGQKSVEVLARETGMSIANVSQHLQTLLDARLVRYEKRGNYSYYRLADESVSDFLVAMNLLAENRLADVKHIRQEFYSKYDETDPIELDTLIDRIENGDLTLMDVRPRDEYEAAHLPHAVSVPIDELEKHLSHLPKDQEIVVYCRGKQCVYAVQAVRQLRKKGYQAYRLEEGIQEWKYRNRPIETNQ
ncbi:MAG: metalloregulator ArsR/SmtB family transcription factor [Bacillaceae bacterium]|nr:metalloregulator ArsR/SmtB family transcription factor [Bacillaceae bacterium]